MASILPIWSNPVYQFDQACVVHHIVTDRLFTHFRVAVLGATEESCCTRCVLTSSHWSQWHCFLFINNAQVIVMGELWYHTIRWVWAAVMLSFKVLVYRSAIHREGATEDVLTDCHRTSVLPSTISRVSEFVIPTCRDQVYRRDRDNSGPLASFLLSPCRASKFCSFTATSK